jgi:hypothetical protein
MPSASVISSRGALVERRLDVKRDAVVASHRDRDGERDQFLGLGVQGLGGERRLGDAGKRLHHLGRAAPQAPQLRRQLFCGFGPARHLPASAV